ncbi:MAG: hypothetical protein QNJ70_19840 [Xenococcaceae cyanobacterium MO_207.B15]|nr:hypothetical protein [Xenococcaceae cyanobacterium MO_207.B15]
MEINRPNDRPPSPDEIAHLENLKSVVEKALEDGKLSTTEMARIKSLIWADGKVSYQELRTIHQTIKSVMGDETPDFQWQAYS